MQPEREKDQHKGDTRLHTSQIRKNTTRVISRYQLHMRERRAIEHLHGGGLGHVLHNTGVVREGERLQIEGH